MRTSLDALHTYKTPLTPAHLINKGRRFCRWDCLMVAPAVLTVRRNSSSGLSGCATLPHLRTHHCLDSRHLARDIHEKREIGLGGLVRLGARLLLQASPKDLIPNGVLNKLTWSTIVRKGVSS